MESHFLLSGWPVHTQGCEPAFSLQLCQCRTLSSQNGCCQNEQSPTAPYSVNESLNGLYWLASHQTANTPVQTQRTLFQFLIGEGHSLWRWGRYGRIHAGCSFGREFSTMVDQRTQNQGHARPISTSQAPPPKGSTGPIPAGDHENPAVGTAHTQSSQGNSPPCSVVLTL